ncbi:hypothetical protein ACFL45_08715 [Candidatus Neomarinimicrobiota bacterium]
MLGWIILNLYFTSLVFDAPLRYFLDRQGLPYLLYLRDAAVFSYIVISILTRWYRGYVRKSELILVAVLAYWFLIGLVQLNVSQVLFGVKVLLPFYFAYLVFPSLISRWDWQIRIFIALWLATLLGVVLDYYYAFPWEGFNYELAGREIEGNRAWGTFGFIRYSGFARASFSAATIITLLSIVVLMSKRHRFVGFLIYSTSLAGIAFTTTKGLVLAYLIVGLTVILVKMAPRIRRLIPLALLLMVVLIPVTAVAGINLYEGLIANDLSDFLLRSLIIRIETAWPRALTELIHGLIYLTGRGLGGIGTAQLYFERGLYNPGDNLFVYLVVTFGFSALPLLVFFTLRISRIMLGKSALGDTAYYSFIVILVFGLTANIIESPSMLIFLGFIYRYITSHRPTPTAVLHAPAKTQDDRCLA